jgi:hypothetical protein
METPEKMLELHPPQQDPIRCQAEGTCGAPLVKCPLHQQHLTCMFEIEGWGHAKPGAEERIATVKDGEENLKTLRYLWSIACSKERPEIESHAARVKARIARIQEDTSTGRALRLLKDMGLAP